MTHTRWRDDFAAVVKGRATAYSGTIERGFKTDMSFTNMIGNGGLLTTVGDLLTWNENLFNPKVGGRAYVDSMQTQGVLRNGRRISYALGLDVGRYNGVAEVSHSGSTAGYRTFLARYPAQSAAPAGVSLTADQLSRWSGGYLDRQTDDFTRLVVRDGKLVNEQARGGGEIIALTPEHFRTPAGADIFFSGTTPKRTVRLVRPDGDTTVFVEVAAAPSSAALQDYVGTYASDELDVKLTIALKDGQLVLRRRPADEFALRPVYPDDYEAPSIGTLRFDRDPSGRVTGFAIFAGRVRNVRFVRHE
jgi:hypothetical protein